MKRISTTLLALGLSLGVASSATAGDNPILGKKLVITDTVAKNGKSKAVFVAKDAGIVKGPVGDPALLDGKFEFYYADTPTNRSTFLLPLGDWDKNTDKLARYKNVTAPVGGDAKVALLKPNRVAKVVGKAKGAIDISTAPGANGVVAIYTVNNGSDGSQHRMCTQFTTLAGSRISYKPIAGGAVGYKLTLKDGVGVTCPSDCSDGVVNGDETDVDCGGSLCSGCAVGQMCGGNADCASNYCSGGICQTATCSDGVQNQDESDIDCGGVCGSTCVGGENCNGGADCTSGSCTGGVCDPANCGEVGSCLMFVTSSSSGGNLGNLSGADSTCNGLASSAGLCGGAGQLPCDFQAWLCDGTDSPASRSNQHAVPYVRTDAAQIAASWADLTDGSISNPINRTENGTDVSGSAPFLPWTYVTTSGTCDNETYLSPGSGPCPAFSNCPTNCDNNGSGTSGWDSSSGFVQGSKGDINATGGLWTDGVTGLCSTPAERIYCIQQ